MLMMVAPALIVPSTILHMKSSSVLVPSSGENSTSSAKERAYFTPSMAIANTESGSFPSLYFMWIGLGATKTWIRFRSASLIEFAAASMSFWTVRARAVITGPWTSRAIISQALN
jgi:hypothetical protein